MRHTVLLGCVLVFGCSSDKDVTLVDAGVDAPTSPACDQPSGEGPSPRGEIAGVFDVARGRFIVLGGNTAAPVDCMPQTKIVDETWAFDFACKSWTALPLLPFGPRARHAAALDTERGRMLVFGGRNRTASGSYQNFADVWALDLATDTWSEVITTGTGPSPRSSASAVYDAAKDRLLVFGGNSSDSGLVLTGLGDLFALDLASGAWTEITAETAPSPRLFHAAVALGGDMIVYGGTPSYDGPFLDDAYAFDLAADTWRLVAASGPDARFGASLVADEAGGRVVLLGGHDGTQLGNRNDAWALDPAGSWSRLRMGDTLHTASGGFCDFPPDFTVPEEGSPERRYAFAATAVGAGVALVFGGKTDCGVVNDVWRLDLTAAGWTLLQPSAGGEACNRTGSTSCATLCF